MAYCANHQQKDCASCEAECSPSLFVANGVVGVFDTVVIVKDSGGCPKRHSMLAEVASRLFVVPLEFYA